MVGGGSEESLRSNGVSRLMGKLHSQPSASETCFCVDCLKIAAAAAAAAVVVARGVGNRSNATSVAVAAAVVGAAAVGHVHTRIVAVVYRIVCGVRIARR